MAGYQEYVKTGVKWIPEIPKQWRLRKIDSLFTERKTKVSDKDFAPLSVTKKGILPQLEHAAKSNDGDNRKLVKVDDFVINSRSDRKGSCGVSSLNGSVSLINIVLTPREELNPDYIHYLLRNYRFSEEYYRNGRGIVADLWTTRYSEMRTIQIPVPPRAEQDQIVRFLDWKISEINKQIQIKKKEITLLQELWNEQLYTLMHYGINKSIKTIESGYRWLGNIPLGWHIRRFSKIAKVCSNLVQPEEYENAIHISPASIEKNTGKILLMQTVKEDGVISPNHYFYKGQILYSKIRPMLNKVTIAPCEGLCSADMYPIETTLNTEYLMYYMLSKNFLNQLSMTGDRVKMPKINQDELSDILVIFPNVEEQNRIVYRISHLQDLIYGQVERIKCCITELQELKSSIISDVVTGKIDVRNIPIPEYERIDDSDADADTSDDAEREAEERGE